MRRGLNIPSVDTATAVIWTSAMLDRLGNAPDPELAKEFGCSIPLVRMLRTRHGRKKFATTVHRICWTPEMDKLVGAISDGRVATLFHLSLESVRHRRQALNRPPARPFIEWSPEKLNALGLECDWVLAERWKCSRPAVTKKRRELGIEACRDRAVAESAGHLQLATNTGVDSAKLLDLHPVVASQRKALGLPVSLGNPSAQ